MHFAQRPIFEHSVSGVGNLPSHVIEEIRKIFLSSNLSFNMPKNVLFSLENCKNRQKLETLPPDPLAFGGPHISHPAL